MHRARAGVGAADGVTGAGGGDQIASAGFGAKRLRLDHDRAAQGDAMFILKKLQLLKPNFLQQIWLKLNWEFSCMLWVQKDF